MIKLNIGNLPILPMKEFEILELAFGADEITFESEDDIFEMSEVIGHHKAMHIVNCYGWVEAQALANERCIDEPLANIEAVASSIVAELVLKHGKEA